MFLQLLPNICSSICLSWVFVWWRKYKCGLSCEVCCSSSSVFTWRHRAGLDYLQQVRLTAYSDQLLGVCRWLRARRLLYLLGRKQTEKDKSLWNVNGADVMCESAHLCMIHRYLSQSPPPPKAGWQNRAAAPVQTPRASSSKYKSADVIHEIWVFSKRVPQQDWPLLSCSYWRSTSVPQWHNTGPILLGLQHKWVLFRQVQVCKTCGNLVPTVSKAQVHLLWWEIKCVRMRCMEPLCARSVRAPGQSGISSTWYLAPGKGHHDCAE